MTKNSNNKTSRLRKENSGCMGGLISMLDFRQDRSTQRLLSDKKYGSARNLDFTNSRSEDDWPFCKNKFYEDAENAVNLSNAENKGSYKAKLGVASIKTLMEEEMSKAWHFTKESSSKIELYEGIAKKKHTEIYDNSNVSNKHFSDIDVTAIMVDYCTNNFHFKDSQVEAKYKTDQLCSKESIDCLQVSELNAESLAVLHKAIMDIAQAILSPKYTNSSKFSGNLEVQCEDNLANALEILNSNKSVFLKLLQDPDLPIRKLIQEQQNAQIGKSFEPKKKHLVMDLAKSKHLQKQSDYLFFRKKEKLTQSNGWSDAKVANKFALLKSSAPKKKKSQHANSSISSIQSHCGLENNDDGRNLSSHFSLKDIKRRFIVAIGGTRKEKYSIAMDGILHKIPFGKQRNNEKESSCRTERVENGDKMKLIIREKQNKNELSFKHMSENKKINNKAAQQKLYREASFQDEIRKHIFESLRVDQKNELNLSSKLSPTEEVGSDSSIQKISTLICQSYQNFNTKNLCSSRQNENSIDCRQNSMSKIGSMEIAETEDCDQIEETSQGKAEFASINNELDLHNGNIDEEESSMEIIEEIPQLSDSSFSATSSFTLPEELRDSKYVSNNAGRPSPISVLEHLYFDSVVSPTSSKAEQGTNIDRITCSREAQIDFSTEPLSSKDSESMQLDEAILFDELETSYGLLIDDPKLLFDLIDMVLTEIKDMHFSCSPWESLLRPSMRNLRRKQDLINEASKKFNFHLDFQFPKTLEHAVKKGIDGGAWLNLHLEADNAVTEIGNVILDYLIEETAQELWD